jgi:polysaccharide pyruvyl transferase WcaK-like protein
MALDHAKVEHVMLIGNYGSANMGDETLLRVSLLDILHDNPKAVAHIPTRNPAFVKTYHQEFHRNMDAFSLGNSRELLRRTLKCRKVIVGGGGIWSGYTGRMAKFLPLYLLFTKVILRKKLLIKGIGVYSTAPALERLLVNLSFLSADRIEARDKDTLQSLWVRKFRKVHLVDDLAMSMPQLLKDGKVRTKYQKLEEKFSKGLKLDPAKKVLGISIKPTKDEALNKNIVKEFAHFIDNLSANTQVVLFPFAKTKSKIEDDTRFMQDLQRRLRSDRHVVVAPHADPFVWYLCIQRRVDAFIGMRFHAVIYAHLAQKPYLAIPYEKKVEEFLKSKKHKDVLAMQRVKASHLHAFLQKHGVN